MIEASACAKFILLGEHAAVYGYPVIALPLSSMRARAVVADSQPGTGLRIVAWDLDEVWVLSSLELEPSVPLLYLAYYLIQRAGLGAVPDIEVTVTSDIPIASGLGSGAAVSVAVARALLSYLGFSLSLSELNVLIYKIEGFYHGNPSGVDNTVIVYERPVSFVRGRGLRLIDSVPFEFLIVDSGLPASTLAAVADVRSSYLSLAMGGIVSSIGDLLGTFYGFLHALDLGLLGLVMVQNHVLLQSLGVSHPVLDRLVFCLLELGASGVKVSGGGQGGNLVVACASDRLLELELLARLSGAMSVVSVGKANDYTNSIA